MGRVAKYELTAISYGLWGLQHRHKHRIMQPSDLGAPVIQNIKKLVIPLVLLIAGFSALTSMKYPDAKFYYVAGTGEQGSSDLQYKEFTMVADLTPSVHSATAVTLDNGNLFSMWYGGTREGHTDVALYSAIFDQKTASWQQHQKVLDRYDVANSLNRYIKKVGNPVLVKHPQGPIVLIYVSVSLAGWATSHLNMAVSYDDGQTWHDSKRLVTSPFINISTLVKNDAVIYQDGTIGISAYHELKGEFSEIVRVNLNGDVINQYRMTSGTNTIQPSLIVNSEHSAIALIRDSSRHTQKVHFTETKDGGKTWSDYEALNIDNPNSAVYGFRDQKNRNWMVFNDLTRDVEFSRNNLALAVADDSGKEWDTVHYFENPEKQQQIDAKYAYPWVVSSKGASFHLLYTVDREHIKHIQFNQTWLESLL